jgi:hypothetical protein
LKTKSGNLRKGDELYFINYTDIPKKLEFVPRLRDSCVVEGINAKYRSDSRGVDFVDCPPKRHDHNTT